MLILVEDMQNVVPVDEKLESMIKGAIELAIEHENFQTDVELNIYFVDDKEIREINKEQRNIDKATDVLSFPMADILKGKLLDGDWDRNPETGLLILGDIIVSTQKAVAQAEEYGHSVEREIMFLITHGVFHVLGYDHMNESDEKEMMEKQEWVLSVLGVTRG